MGEDMSSTGCFRMGCGNPSVERDGEIPACSKHGGETAPKWGAHHPIHGWLTDTGAGGSYSHDVDDAQWWDTFDDAVEGIAALLENEDIVGEPSELYNIVRLK